MHPQEHSRSNLVRPSCAKYVQAATQLVACCTPHETQKNRIAQCTARPTTRVEQNKPLSLHAVALKLAHTTLCAGCPAAARPGSMFVGVVQRQLSQGVKRVPNTQLLLQ